MKKIAYLTLIILFIGCKEHQNDSTKNRQEKEIEIEFNKNIETIGIILDLSELGDFILSLSNEDRNYEFIRLIRKEFNDFIKHPAVLNFNKLNELNLAKSNHFYYGLSFTNLPEFEINHQKYDEFYSSDKFTKHQVDSILNDFDKSIKDFYIKANLEKYFKEKEQLYKNISSEIRKIIPNNILETMENYFGEYGNSYVICPSPTIPTGWNFGPDKKKGDYKIFYYLTGPSYDIKPSKNNLSEITVNDNLGFNDKENLRDLAIHEFGHSFVRFLDIKSNKILIEKLSLLNTEELKANFKKIGEGTEWNSIFEEHLVRANEILIWRKLGEVKIAKEKLEYEFKTERILYINEFVQSLEKFENNRKEYLTLESYFSELINDLTEIKIK